MFLAVWMLLVGGSAFAQSLVEWHKTSVIAKLDNNGAVRVEEIHELTASGDAKFFLRNLLVGPDQSAEVHSVSLVEMLGTKRPLQNARGGPNSYQAWAWGLEIWLRSESDPPFDVPVRRTYSIEYTLRGAITPAWDLASGLEPFEQGTRPPKPLDRARDVLAGWRAAWPDLTTTYRLDHDVEFPTRGSPSGLAELNYRFEYDTAWVLLDKDRDIGVATPDVDYRVQRALRYLPAGRPKEVDTQAAAFRLGGALGPFLLCMALALLFFAADRAIGRGPRGDRALFERVIEPLPPESIAARFGGSGMAPSFETFLLRLAVQKKITIGVEKAATDETNAKVSLRLLVPRSQLTPFERSVVDELFSYPDTVATSDIQDRKRGGEFDPDDLVERAFEALAPPKRRVDRKRALWSMLQLALIGGGLGLMVKCLVDHTMSDPVAIFAGLVPGNIVAAFCPTGSASKRVSLFGLMASAMVFGLLGLTLALCFNAPLPAFAALGLGLTSAGHFAGYLAGIPKSRAEDLELEAARGWALGELCKPRPALRDAWVEWLEALGAKRALAKWKLRASDFTMAPDMADMGLGEVQAGPPFTGEKPRPPSLPEDWVKGFSVFGDDDEDKDE